MAAPLQDNEKDALIARLQNENRSLIQEKSILGLNYNHKKEDGIEARHLANNDIPIFTRVPELSTMKTDEDVDHLLIEGDNLPALVALLPTYRNKVNVIYIDPPYNTGNDDFVYNDRYVDCEDGFRHSKWLSFMKPRLQLAHEMLSDDGVIFVSIDDHEQAYLKVMMDGIFGESNFVANLVWKGGRTNNAKRVSSGHDYILTYAKNVSNLPIWREEKAGTDRIYAAGKNAYDEAVRTVQSPLENSEDANYIYHKNIEERATSIFKKWWKNLDKDDPAQENKHYNRIDGWTGRVFFAADINNPSGHGDRYEILHPTMKKPVPIPTRGWLYNKEKMTELFNKHLLYFGTDETRTINIKRFLDEIEGKAPDSVFYVDRRAAQQELKKIFGSDVFSYPKDVNVLKRWIRIAAPKNALVLDFFAGSGTTGQAVAELNKEDGGNRKCILITNNFEQDGAPNGIARDITSVRMKRVLTGKEWADGKKHEPLPGNLIYYRLDWQPMSTSLTNLPGMLPLSTFLGSLSINQDANRLMNAPDNMPTLSKLVHDGHAALLTNENNSHMVLALDADTSDDFDALDTVKEELEGANLLEGLNVAMESGFDADTYMDSGVFDHEFTFPVPDIIQMQATVKMLKKDGVI